jgi:hypothetical protein
VPQGESFEPSKMPPHRDLLMRRKEVLRGLVIIIFMTLVVFVILEVSIRVS